MIRGLLAWAQHLKEARIELTVMKRNHERLEKKIIALEIEHLRLVAELKTHLPFLKEENVLFMARAKTADGGL